MQTHGCMCNLVENISSGKPESNGAIHDITIVSTDNNSIDRFIKL